MKKVGYFFYTFVPLLAVEAIQTIALFFMMGMGVFGQGFVGKLAFRLQTYRTALKRHLPL